MGIFDWFRGKSDDVVLNRAEPPIRRNVRYASAGNRAYYGSFNSSSGSADYELSTALPRIRNRVRALSRDNGTMKRYLSLLKTNVVGENGFKLQVRVKTGEGRPDRNLNSRVEQAWSMFCKHPTIDGVMDIIELEKQMVMTWARDGEYIIEIVRSSVYADGFALNPIEGDILDHTLNTIHPPTGNEIRLGVEINKAGMPVAYHFLNQHPGDVSWISPSTTKRYRRVTADRVIHVFERLRPGQTRGEPQPSSMILTAKMQDGYREAEITARRIKASTMGLMVNTGAEGAKIDGLGERVSDDGHFEMTIEPGTIKKLPEGYDFRTFDANGTTSDFAQFDQQMKSETAMGLSISPVSLGYETAKLSYSTHRGIVAEDRETYSGLQSFFIRMALNKIFEYWLMMHSSVNVMSNIPPTRLKAISTSYKFTGRGWDQIDPTKDTKAENDQLAARTTSLSAIAAKRGLSRDDLLDEIQDDERALKERGLTANYNGGKDSKTPLDEDEDEDVKD